MSYIVNGKIELKNGMYIENKEELEFKID